MRLDKFIVESGLASRSEITKVAKNGGVTVNGQIVRRVSGHIDPTADKVTYLGKDVIWREFTYVMLNKPEGYVSATEDKNAPVVTDLLMPADAARVHPCGRLDKYTLGMMILTDDGEMSHRLLAPARHVPKTYRYRCELPLSESDEKRLCEGVHIEGGYLTKPCEMSLSSEFEGEITLHEGKYHQIKQMFGAVGNKITYLERITFGPLALDPSLDRGEWRYLTADEIALLAEAAK